MGGGQNSQNFDHVVYGCPHSTKNGDQWAMWLRPASPGLLTYSPACHSILVKINWKTVGNGANLEVSYFYYIHGHGKAPYPIISRQGGWGGGPSMFLDPPTLTEDFCKIDREILWKKPVAGEKFLQSFFSKMSSVKVGGSKNILRPPPLWRSMGEARVVTYICMLVLLLL